MADDEHDLLERGSETVREHTPRLGSNLTRPGENRVKQWFLLTGSRLTVTAILLVLVVLALLGLSLVRPIDVTNLIAERDAAGTLFSALLSGAILLVSIVVSINSIVLSQEITDIENQQERISASIEYRQHIEEFIEADVTPARPGEFLRTVLYAISRQAVDLRQIAAESSVEGFEERVDQLVTEIGRDIRFSRNTLGDAQIGTFAVLLAGLSYDYSGQLHAARSLKRDFGDDLDDREREALDDLVAVLQHIATGREYFKSLYYKRELARLSAILLYVSLPVIVFTSYVILALDANLLPEIGLLGLPPLLVSFLVAYAIALTPYVVLTAYVVRASTITIRTLAAGPFILQEGSEVDSFEWEEPDAGREWNLTDESNDD